MQCYCIYTHCAHECAGESISRRAACPAPAWPQKLTRARAYARHAQVLTVLQRTYALAPACGSSGLNRREQSSEGKASSSRHEQMTRERGVQRGRCRYCCAALLRVCALALVVMSQLGGPGRRRSVRILMRAVVVGQSHDEQ